MTSLELPLVFDCVGDALLGILHQPERPADTGVLVIVGGPQYRVGSHRQFVRMARDLAAAGTSVMRFDCRGMGDSDGERRSFEYIDADIRAAIDAFMAASPGLQQVVLWGLCGSASACLLAGHQDARVAGLVLVNPWVRTEHGRARTQLRHYYLARAMDPAFWQHLRRGSFSLRASMGSLAGLLATAMRRPAPASAPAATAGAAPAAPVEMDPLELRNRMLHGLRRFGGPVLVILSGKDLVAGEFADLVRASPAWAQALSRPHIEQHTLPEADHSFSARTTHQAATALMLAWLPQLAAAGAAAASARGKLHERACPEPPAVHPAQPAQAAG